MMMKSAAPAPPSLPRLGVGALVVDPANENYPAPLLFRLISFLYDRACSVPLPFSLMGNTEPDKEREILAVLDIFKDTSTDVSSQNVAVVAEATRRYLQTLTEPLFTFAYYDSFMLTEGLSEISDKIIVYQTLLSYLPRGYRTTAKHVMLMLSRVAANQPVTQTDSKMLANLFGNVFLHPSEKLFYMADDTPIVVNVISSLIDNADAIWKAQVSRHRLVSRQRPSATQPKNVTQSPRSSLTLSSSPPSSSSAISSCDSPLGTPKKESMQISMQRARAPTTAVPASTGTTQPIPVPASQKSLLTTTDSTMSPSFLATPPTGTPTAPTPTMMMMVQGGTACQIVLTAPPSSDTPSPSPSSAVPAPNTKGSSNQPAALTLSPCTNDPLGLS